MTIASLRPLISGAIQASFCPTGHLSGTFHSEKEGKSARLCFRKYYFIQQTALLSLSAEVDDEIRFYIFCNASIQLIKNGLDRVWVNRGRPQVVLGAVKSPSVLPASRERRWAGEHAGTMPLFLGIYLIWVYSLSKWYFGCHSGDIMYLNGIFGVAWGSAGPFFLFLLFIGVRRSNGA